MIRNQANYEKIEEMYRQALALTETVLGKEHPTTLTSMNNLAEVLSSVLEEANTPQPLVHGSDGRMKWFCASPTPPLAISPSRLPPDLQTATPNFYHMIFFSPTSLLGQRSDLFLREHFSPLEQP